LTTSLSVHPHSGQCDFPRIDKLIRALKFGHEPQERLDATTDSLSDASVSLIFPLVKGSHVDQIVSSLNVQSLNADKMTPSE
jgi:hypothetical protein